MTKNQDKKSETNLTKSLEKLNSIVTWFDEQEDIDVERGLEKVREAARLIKGSKKRLTQIENEFKEIEKEIGEDDVKDMENEDKNSIFNKDDDRLNYDKKTF